MVFVYAFLYIPIAFMIFFSFNASSSLNKWAGFSLIWYEKLFTNTKLWSAFLTSFQVAFSSATFAVLIGLLSALFFVRASEKRRHFWEFLSKIPLVMPEVITGLAFLIFFVTIEKVIGWPMGRGTKTITIAHTTLSLAYVSALMKTKLLEFDRNLEEAALDLGAKPLSVFFNIKLPFLFPSLIASWLLAFTLSMDDFVVASFTSGPNSTTLPMFLFSTLKTGVTPEINALSTFIIALVTCFVPLLTLLVYFSRRRSQKL
jgi:putrescine transport system permease protein